MELKSTQAQLIQREKMASLGDDGKSLGDRQAPTASYAKFSPDFHFDEKKPRIETVNVENPFHMLRKLEQLTMFFTTTMHPYAPAHDQEYELSVMTMNNGIGDGLRQADENVALLVRV